MTTSKGMGNAIITCIVVAFFCMQVFIVVFPIGAQWV